MPLGWERRGRGSSIVTTCFRWSTVSQGGCPPTWGRTPGPGAFSPSVVARRRAAVPRGSSLSDVLLGGQGRADDAGVVEQLRGDDGRAGRQQRRPLVRLLAHPAADDDE